MTGVEEVVRALVARRGTVPFAEVVDLALYHPEQGFYSSGGQAGRRGDFLTSPEVGPLFGAVVARALDAWWAEAGHPPVFVVVEAGAGPGTLARSVLSAGPACAPALRYVLVEPSAAQRRIHAERLPIEDAPWAFAEVAEGDDARRAPSEPPPGPVVVSLPDLPRVAGSCVVLANELLDNLPFDLLERTPGGWSEVHVGVGPRDELTEVLVPVEAAPDGGPAALAPDAPLGARLPVQAAASAWLRDALELAGSAGRVVALDYGAATAELAARPWRDWVRTYRGHAPGGHPLERLGTQDITCEVAIDQLRPRPGADRPQAAWLRAHGIDELVAQGRREWRERAHIGDLAALRARSRAPEAAALLDETGLGSFRVLEWCS